MNRKELVSESRKALQFLHKEMQFDFLRPCVVIKGEGRFTHNTVCKEISRHISGDYAAAVLIRRERKYQNDSDLYFVRVGLGRFLTDRVRGYSYDIDDFYTVGDFEECRKTQTKHYYIIAQAAENLTAPKQERTRSAAARYKYIPDRYEMCGDGRGGHYVQKVRLMWRDASGEIFDYKPYSGMYIPSEAKAATAGDIVDKSGYLVIERRRDLQRRAAKLRAERKAAAARVADFSAQEKAIEQKLESVRAEIAAAVMQCNTYENSKRIDSAAGELMRALYRLENHRERRAAEKYTSPESIEKALHDIDACLEKASAALVADVQ